MGTYINTVIGWGITGLAPHDPRIDQSALNSALDDPTPVLERYRALLAKDGAAGDVFARMALSALEEGAGEELETLLCPVLGDGPRCSDMVALVVVPPGYADWRRSDDTIDFELAVLDGNVDQAPTAVRALGRAPFPFSAWMDAVTGDRLYGPVNGVLHALGKGDLDEAGALSKMVVRGTESRTVLYSGADEARERIVPVVPSPVRHLVEAAGVLTAPDGWLGLRPVVASWWE